MDRCEEDWYASDKNLRGTPHSASSGYHAEFHSRRPCWAVALRRTAWSEYGMGAAWQVWSDTAALRKSNGKSYCKPLATRHGRWTAWARHAMCESAFRVFFSCDPNSIALLHMTSLLSLPWIRYLQQNVSADDRSGAIRLPSLGTR